MKNKILIVIAFSLLFSCNRKEKVDVSEEAVLFKITNTKKSEFVKVGNNSRFEFIGTIQNTSEFIFDNVVTDVEIELELENGNLITERDYEKGWDILGGMIDSQTSWKQNESRIIYGLGDDSGISSTYIPDHYFEYPVKKVFAVFKLKAEDLINRTKNENKIIVDVTDKWIEISKKPKKSNVRKTYNN